MKERIKLLRYFISTLAVSMACSMVSFAQVTAPAANKAIAAQAKANKAMEDWRTKMIADWTRAKEYTKEYLDVMPEDGTNYKPNAQDKDQRTFAEQMLHFTAANFAPLYDIEQQAWCFDLADICPPDMLPASWLRRSLSTGNVL